jgi:hypothetical protein
LVFRAFNAVRFVGVRHKAKLLACPVKCIDHLYAVLQVSVVILGAVRKELAALTIANVKKAALASRLLYRLFLLITRAFGSRCRFSHSFAHFCLYCIEVKTRAALHRRVIKERLELLSHQLLNEYEAPELVFEPIKVLLSPLFCPVARPARTFKWIEA